MAAKNNPTFWAFIVVLVLGHFILHVAIGMTGLTPDLLTLAALFAARRLRAAGAAGLGFVLGLLEDGLALTAFGARAIATTVAAYLGARSRDLLEGDSILFLIFYLFVGKWLRDAVVFLLLQLSGAARGDTMSNLLIDGPIRALTTAVAGILAFMMYRALTGER
jgi:rod shape-determining protein MreD